MLSSLPCVSTLLQPVANAFLYKYLHPASLCTRHCQNRCWHSLEHSSNSTLQQRSIATIGQQAIAFVPLHHSRGDSCDSMINTRQFLQFEPIAIPVPQVEHHNRRVLPAVLA